MFLPSLRDLPFPSLLPSPYHTRGVKLNHPLEIEVLVCAFHKVYQDELKRQGKESKYSDDYKQLPEDIKDLDRALARFVLTNIACQHPCDLVIEEEDEIVLHEDDFPEEQLDSGNDLFSCPRCGMDLELIDGIWVCEDIQCGYTDVQ
jgi:hypothetical protein